MVDAPLIKIVSRKYYVFIAVKLDSNMGKY